MVTLNVYNKEGEIVKEKELKDEIFNVKINKALLHQVSVSYLSNKRQSSAKTKGRSEVKGGSSKPWRQKGTGRARHGSIRSPIWVGGGVVHGPTPDRNYKKKITKKMKNSALKSALSWYVKENKILILDDLKIEKPKTKDIFGILSKLKIAEKRIIIVLADNMKNEYLSIRNIPKTSSINCRDLNTLDILRSSVVVFTEKSIDFIQEERLK